MFKNAGICFHSNKSRYNRIIRYILRKNKQFAQLSKQLYLKYKIFSAVPPEAQMIMLVATSAYVCVGINAKKKEQLNNNDENIMDDEILDTDSIMDDN